MCGGDWVWKTWYTHGCVQGLGGKVCLCVGEGLVGKPPPPPDCDGSGGMEGSSLIVPGNPPQAQWQCRPRPQRNCRPQFS